MPAPNEAQIYLGQVLGGRFEVQRYRAHGGFCLVFEGTDRESGSEVAIKVLTPGADRQDVLEFENEASLLQLLQRASHVVTLVHAGKDTVPVIPLGRGVAVPLPVHYIVLELADASLDELLVRRDQLSFASKLGLFRDVVHGVHQMHVAGIMHRDVKAENGLVFHRPHKPVVKLTDLGRSKRLSEPVRFLAEEYINGRGDITFAPPEGLWGQLGWDELSLRRADLYLPVPCGFRPLRTGLGPVYNRHGPRDRGCTQHRAVVSRCERGRPRSRVPGQVERGRGSVRGSV